MAGFKDLINGDKPVLVDFSAEWCGPCKMLAPVLKELASETEGRLRILKIDVDRNQELAAKLQVRGVPTLVLYNKGEQLWRQSGAMDINSLRQVVNQYL